MTFRPAGAARGPRGTAGADGADGADGGVGPPGPAGDHTAGVFRPEDYGDVETSAATCTAAIDAAVVAAEAYGPGSVIELGARVYLYIGSWSLSGKSFMIRGVSGRMVGTESGGTVIRAVAQTGPVLDFTGYLWPANFVGRVAFEGFMLEGDGTAGAAKKGFANTGGYGDEIYGAAFRDITTRNTGGAGVYVVMAYLSLFENIVVETPVDVQASGVPYFHIKACNGNTWKACGVRSLATTEDTWEGGAFRVEEHVSLTNDVGFMEAYENCWAENLHVPSDGTLFHLAANDATIDNWQNWDCEVEVGATGITSEIRIVDLPFQNYGGNEIRGLIPGRLDAVGFPSVGIDLRQSNNLIHGVKGYNGRNVQLAAGVGHTSVVLEGQHADTTATSAFIDNSGETTNQLVDRNYLHQPQIRWGTGSPEGEIAAGIGSVYQRKDGNGVVGVPSLYVKETGDGTDTGWVPYNPARLAAQTVSNQIADPDDVTETGFSVWNVATAVGMADAHLLSVMFTEDYGSQIALPIYAVDGTEMWQRTKDAGVWGAWAKKPGATGDIVVSEHDIAPGTDITYALTVLFAAHEGFDGARFVFPPGEYEISSTVVSNEFSGSLVGNGLGQVVFRWTGDDVSPMFFVHDYYHLRFADIRFEGDDTNPPTALVESNWESTTDTQGGNSFLRFDRCHFGKWWWSSQGSYKGAAAIGVLFSGDNGNNDQFSFRDCTFEGANIPVSMPNTQSVWGIFDNCLFSDADIGLKTSSNVTVINPQFNDCGQDFQINDSAEVTVLGWQSEQSGQLAEITYTGRLIAHGGHVRLMAPMTGDTDNFIDAQLATDGGGVALHGLTIDKGTLPTHPKLKLRATGGGSVGGFLTIRDCFTRMAVGDFDVACTVSNSLLLDIEIDSFTCRRRFLHAVTLDATTIGIDMPARWDEWAITNTVADADTVTESGLAFLSNGAAVGMVDALLFSVMYNASWGAQTAMAVEAADGSETWRRTKVSGTWGAWKKQADSDDLAANATADRARANHTGTQTAATISDFSTAADARVAAAVGVTVQGYDADLSTIAGLTATTDNMLQSVAGIWASRTPAQVKAALAIAAVDLTNFNTAADGRISAAVGVSVQAYDADLATIAGLTPTTDNIIQSVAGAWASRTPTQVKAALGIVRASLTGDVALVGNATENVIKQVLVPAASLIAGSTIRVVMYVTPTTSVTALTPALRWGINGTLADTKVGNNTSAATVTPVTGNTVRVEFLLTLRTPGAAGVAVATCNMTAISGGSTLAAGQVSNPPTVTSAVLDTTSLTAVSATLSQATAGATVTQCTIDVLT